MTETETVYGAEGVRAIVGEAERLRAEVEKLRRSPASATLSAHDHVRELIVERDEARARAAEHHHRGDEARHEAAVLRVRVAELEAALRDVCEAHRSRVDPDDDHWCKRCGSSWRASKHIGGCPVGRALRVLGDAGVPGGAVASEGGCAGPVPDDLVTGGTR